MPEYHITEEKIIVRDLDNASAINSIILIAKKVIYNCMKKEQKPCILYVKNDTKKSYLQKKYRLYVKGQKNIFDKQYKLLTKCVRCEITEIYKIRLLYTTSIPC